MEMLNTRGRGVFESLNGTVYGNYSSPNAVVLLHGFGTDQAVWHRIVPVLACFFKVVVFNLAFNDAELYDRNKYSNYSGYADDLICVLDELDLRKVSYVGHSMAAMIGCIAAVRRPDRFGQLILLGGSPRYLNSEGYVGGFEQAEVDAIFDNISSNYTNWIMSFAPEVIMQNNTEAVSFFEEDLMNLCQNITLDSARVVFLSDYRCVLPLVNVTTAIIQSRSDKVVPSDVPVYMKQHLGIPTELKILSTDGHFPMLTAPSLLLDVLKEVLGVEKKQTKA